MSSTVSVIDDDPSVRLAANNLLTSRGYTVHTFGSAHDFLQSAELSATSCVITDVHMAVMSGIDLLMHMRDLGQLTPFIFMTAFPDDAVRDRALKAGAICFLAKPFSTPVLIQYLETALSGPVTPRCDVVAPSPAASHDQDAPPCGCGKVL